LKRFLSAVTDNLSILLGLISDISQRLNLGARPESIGAHRSDPCIGKEGFPSFIAKPAIVLGLTDRDRDLLSTLK
jgi:hypothetical protein